MRKKTQLFLFVWPVVLIAVFLIYHSYERWQIDQTMGEAHGLIWQAGENRLVVHATEIEEGELLYIELDVTGQQGTSLFHSEEVIDRDMFGGGFVKAVQVDKDADKEIVVWGRNSTSYYLDFTGTNVIQISFEKATQEIKALALRWHRFNVMAGMEIVLMVLLAVAYYILLGSVAGVVWLVRRLRKKKQSVQASW